MTQKVYFYLQGNNGATYIFNTKNWRSITYSLKFYKTRSSKQAVLKVCLQFFLFSSGWLYKVFRWHDLKDSNEVSNYLENISSEKIDFELDDNCSLLVSPTRDKIIIHQHNEFFQKIAFGNSLKKVCNEVVIYKLLEKPLVHFHLSNIYDIYQEDNYCGFKLTSNTAIKEPAITTGKLEFVSALVELFSSVPNQQHTISNYLETLQSKLSVLGQRMADPLEQLIVDLKNKKGDLIIPLGLVHRDFKPWNIINDDNLLIYDFEETVTDGPPLEDLFNYFIDPDIRYKSSKYIAAMIFDSNKVKLYQVYLEKLNLDINFRVLLYIYLINRAIYWLHENESATSVSYQELISYLIFESKK